MEKIATIVDPSFRTGIGKGGQPWTLMKITTDSGKQASCFSPANIGDPVTLEYNEEYKNYSAKVVTGAKMEQVIEKEKQEDKLTEILDRLEAILEILNATGQPSGYEKAKATAESLRPETEEEEVNLDDIPF